MLNISLRLMAAYSVFNLFLIKRASLGLCIVAEIFAFAAFAVNSLIKGIVHSFDCKNNFD